MNLETISEFSLAGVSALIVEDENLVAMDVESLLRDFGAPRVWTTGALMEARRIMTENADISIVLLDLKLRDGCGEELLAELAEANVPVIVTTGYAGFSCALAPVIYKPYSTEGLLEKILGLLWRSRREVHAQKPMPKRRRHFPAAALVRPTEIRRRHAVLQSGRRIP